MTASHATKQGALHPPFKVDVLCGELLIQCWCCRHASETDEASYRAAEGTTSPSGSEVLLLTPKVGDHN